MSIIVQEVDTDTIEVSIDNNGKHWAEDERQQVAAQVYSRLTIPHYSIQISELCRVKMTVQQTFRNMIYRVDKKLS